MFGDKMMKTKEIGNIRFFGCIGAKCDCINVDICEYSHMYIWNEFSVNCFETATN
jgi:hypothetical protein